MKKIITILSICSLVLCSICSCSGPFDETKCIIEGTLTIGGNPCMSRDCLPGMGLWINSTDKSYIIDAYWLDSPEQICVGETVARWGDYIKAYGTSRSYREYNGDIFYEISIDSLILLTPREERHDTIQGTIRGAVYIFPYNEDYNEEIIEGDYSGQVYIDNYQLIETCYTPNEDFSCVAICELELCKHGPEDDFRYDQVEAQGTIFRSYDDYGFLQEKIDVTNIKLIE